MKASAIFAVVALCIASFSAVNAGLAGLRINKALTDASREDRFEIVTINPTTGVASSTPKSVFALYDGAIDFTNVVIGPSSWVLSFQTFDQTQVIPGLSFTNVPGTPLNEFRGSNPVVPISNNAYLARQDLREGGRFEFCELSRTILPVLAFWDSDSSVVAVTVNTGTNGFNLHRIGFAASSSTCSNTVLASLPAFNSVSTTVSHQRGNRIYIVTEPAGGFSTTAANIQIRAFDVVPTSNNIVNQLNPISLASTVIPLSLNSLSADVVVFTAWNSALSTNAAGFATYETNLITGVTSTSVRSVATTGEEVTFANTIVNQTNTLYNLKNIPTSTSAAVAQVTFTSFATAAAGETKTTSVLNTQGIFKLFDLQNATVNEANVESATSTSISLNGPWTYASTNTATGALATLGAKCRLTYNAAATSSVIVDATGAGDSANCPLGTVPTGTSSIDVEFAADGVNYGSKTSVGYAAFNNALVTNGRFARSQYNLRDATALRGEPVRIILLDAAGRKIFFHQALSVTLTLVPQGNTVLRQAVGTTGVVGNGVVTFPNLAIDIDRAESNGVGNIRATATVGSNTFTTLISVAQFPKTSGTLAALAFPTTTLTSGQVFETHLINPALSTTTAALRIASRSLVDNGAALGLGLVTYDRDNKVLNTVEVSGATSGAVLLNGQTISTTLADNRGSGVCRLPASTIATTQDVPSAIFYEGTSATDRSSTFIGVVHNVDNNGAVGRKVQRYTRQAGSVASTLCTVATVDSLPVYDTQYGNHHIQLLNGGRLAIVEPDFFFTATNSTASAPSGTYTNLLSVWQLSTASTPGSWVIRNKPLPLFSVLGITQSGDDEIAINGATNTDGTAGIWLVDVSNQFGQVSGRPTQVDGNRFSTTTNEQAYFLSAGSFATNNDARLRYTGFSSALGTTAAQSIETVTLNRGSTAVAPVRVADVTGRNYIDFFTLDDAAVVSVSPSALNLNQASAVSVVASNVITSSQLRCRFSSATGVPAAVDFVVNPATTATSALSQDNVTVNCGTIPSVFTTSRAWVYVQVSNDGGLNYGPEQRISVGGITDAINPSVSVSASANVISVAFSIKFRTSLTNPNTEKDTAVRVAIIALVNTLSSIWTKPTQQQITTTVEADGTTSYSIVVSTTTSNNSRLTAKQVTSLSAAQLATELASVFTPNGVAAPSLQAVGVLANGVSIARTTTTGTSSSDSGLSDGAIAGIVIGSVVGGLLIIGLIAWLIFANKKAASPYSAAARARSADVGVVSSSGSSASSSTDSYYDEDDDDYEDADYDEEDYEDYI